MPISLEQLREIAQQTRNAPLLAAVRVSVTSAIQAAGMEAIDANRFPLVQIRARHDACPFCSAMNLKVLRKDTHNAYLPPFHINCRCVAVHLPEGAMPVDFRTEEVEPLLPRAHFVRDRVKRREVRYEALQIPARVEGRDFIFRRRKDPETGQWVTKLEFRRPPDRTMPSLFLQGLLPPPGGKPIVSLTELGRALRQLPAEEWQRFRNVEAIIVPPRGTELDRELNREKAMSTVINNLLIINTTMLIDKLSVADDKVAEFISLLRHLR